MKRRVLILVLPLIACLALAAWMLLPGEPRDVGRPGPPSRALDGSATDVTLVEPEATAVRETVLTAPSVSPPGEQPLQVSRLEIEAVDDTSGDPVSAFDVHLSVQQPAAGDVPAHEWLRHDEKGRRGRARIDPLRFVEGSSVVVTLHAVGMLDPPQTEEDRRSRTQTFEPVAGETRTLRFRLLLDLPERAPDALVLTGRVLDASTSEPVAGARVECSSRSVATDERGRFRVAHPEKTPPGLLVEHPDYITDHVFLGPGGAVVQLGGAEARDLMKGGSAKARTSGGPEIVLAPADASSSAPAGTSDAAPAEMHWEIRLRPCASLSGVVLDRHRLPAPGVPLLCSNADDRHETQRAETDETGRFRFGRLQGGKYELYVLSAAGGMDDSPILSLTYDVSPSEQREVELELESQDSVELSGRVLPTNAGSVPLVPMFFGADPESGRVQSRCDADGRYRCSLARGRYLVLIVPSNDDVREGPFALMPEIEVKGSGAQQIDFELPTDTVTGFVRGVPPSDKLRVIALPASEVRGPARELLASSKLVRLIGAPVGADGAFELHHVAPGRTRLELRLDGRTVASKEIDVQGPIDVGDWLADRN